MLEQSRIQRHRSRGKTDWAGLCARPAKCSISACQSDDMISSSVQKSQIFLHRGPWGSLSFPDVNVGAKRRFDRAEKDGEEKPLQYPVTTVAISNELVVKQGASCRLVYLLRHTISTRTSMRSLQEGRLARPGFLPLCLGSMKLFKSVVPRSYALPGEKYKHPVYL